VCLCAYIGIAPEALQVLFYPQQYGNNLILKNEENIFHSFTWVSEDDMFRVQKQKREMKTIIFTP
jgi:hypothetical protein